MQARPSDQPQQWSVQAQFTISHPGIDDPNSAPQTRTERDENGVRMFYTWTSQPNTGPSGVTQDTQTATTASDTSTSVTESIRQPLPTYGFQRGNMMFTSVPPPRRPFGFNEPISSTDHPKLNVVTNLQDSGYNSELLSPNSFASGGLPRKPAQPYNRKCRSTCSIVLSTTINEQPELEDNGESVAQQTHCGRTQSLKCQTPTARNERSSGFYGCGDPWCYHSGYEDDGSTRFSPAQDSEKSYHQPPQTAHKRPFRTNSFTTRDVTRSNVPEVRKLWETENRVKDAAVQTFEMVDKCTSPFMKMDSFHYRDEETQDNLFKKEKTLKKRSSYNSRSRTEPVFMRTHSPSSFTPDSLESQEPARRLVRNPAKLYGKSQFLSDRQSSASDSKSSDPTKKPRTVHIDVYCTGTEQESDGSNSSSDIESKTASSPQTVFESERVRITHSRSHDKDLPLKLKEQLSASSSRTDIKNCPIKEDVESKPGNDSDNDDNTSTAYPSQISSYSAIPGLSSFASSVPPSWSTYSMSVDNDYDSVANTSWKDTFSDIDSLNRSRSSIAPTDSLDFVPRKLMSSQKSESIEEHPEVERKTVGSPSVASLNPSDSFEYANSEDKVRIRRMEHLWSKPGTGNQAPWKSPRLERKHLLQQQKLKEYVEKRLSGISLPKSESRDSDSGSDSSEKGWSFVKDDDKKLQRDVTVRRASRDGGDQSSSKPETIKEEKTQLSEPQLVASRRSPAVRSPSVMAIQEKLYLNPTLRAPFMVVPGIFTDQRYVARRFGSVVDVFRKPGHHVGPAKNPECQCDHCRRFFENGGRGRARSVGEVPMNYPWMNWRSSRHSQPREPQNIFGSKETSINNI